MNKLQLISAVALLSVSSFALAAKTAPKPKAATEKAKTVKLKKIDICDLAETELQSLRRSLEAGDWKLPTHWTIEGDVKGDLDGNGTQGRAVVLSRTFENVEEVEDAFSSENSADAERDLRTVSFLVLEVGVPGKKKILISKGPAFSIATRNFLVEKDLKMAKNVLVASESTMMGMGGWTATNTTWKWRKEGEDFRLIGLTEGSMERNTGDSESKDTNLLTGLTVKKTDPGDMTDDTEAKPSPKKKGTVRQTKGKPQKKFLTQMDHCTEEDAPVFTPVDSTK